MDERDSQQTLKNHVIIDSEKIKGNFKSFKKISEDIRRNSDSKEAIKIFPKIIELNSDKQNHHLTSIKNNEKEKEVLSEYLPKKSHKNESDLLFNNIHISRYKKEIFAKKIFEENQIPMNNKSYPTQWISSLRKRKKFIEKIKTYRQFREENSPLYSISVEKQPKTEEYKVDSGYDLTCKGFKNFENYTQKNKDKKSLKMIKKFRNLQELRIDDKNLFDFEYKLEISVNKRKIIYNSSF